MKEKLRRAVERSAQSSDRARPDLTLTAFKQRLWRDYEHARHQEAIDALLGQVGDYVLTGGARGVKRAMIFLPPRHGKTRSVSNYFPAWMLGQNPDLRLIMASYGSTLALRNSRFVRNLIASDEYRALYPGVELAQGSAAVDIWDIRGRAGGAIAVGVGGGITGHGANCFPAGTLVLSESGNIPIDQLHGMSNPPRVLAYDHKRNRATWADIEATRMVSACDLVEITTESGRIVRATPEHPFYVIGQGYVPAERLVAGDTLESRTVDSPDVRFLRKTIRATRLSSSKTAKAQLRRCLLLNRVQSVASCRKERSKVRALRKANAKQAEQQVLLIEVSDCFSTSGHEAMPILRGGVSPQDVPVTVLFADVCQSRAFTANAWQGEFSLPAGQQLLEDVCGNATADTGAGRRSLCGMWRKGEEAPYNMVRAHDQSHQPSHSPHRREPSQQLTGQSRYFVQGVPRGASQVETDRVAVVRHLRTDNQPVYDIQVAGFRNFFADGILVHNCIIVDDVVKSRAEAESETYREKTVSWYTDDLLTRLEEPGGAIIVMLTRWHTADLAGWLLDNEPDDWTVLSLPALAEANDPLGREVGEALWPARYNADTLNDRRERMGSYSFAALYQQSPLPSGGGLFDAGKVKVFETPPACTKAVRFYDLAVTAKRSADYTVGLKLGVTADEQYVVLDIYRVQKEFPDVQEAIIQNMQIDGRDVRVRLEAEKAGIVGLQFLMRDSRTRPYTLDAQPPEGDKYTRALPIAARVEAGRLGIVRADWNRAFLDELAVFPAGAHDDQVDALSGAYGMLDAPEALIGSSIGAYA